MYSVDPMETGVGWLQRFADAVEQGDAAALARLIEPGGHWRDVVALTWDFRRRTGPEAIAEPLIDAARAVHMRDMTLSTRFPAPRAVNRSARDVIEVIFDFVVDAGEGVGVARLVPAGDDWVAWTIFTSLHEVRADVRPQEGDPELVHRDPREVWSVIREREQRHEADPEVLIVGAGHSGLMIAARLKHDGVDALVVEKTERVGDNWRQRYDSLALHTPKQSCSLPYMPYPDTFPMWLPKDKLADWYESYASALELNIWTGSEVRAATYDAEAERWTVTIKKTDGSTVEVHTPHLVLATGGGFGSVPFIPEIPGLDEFRGEVIHTKHFKSGKGWAGKRALVIGASTSGHDVAYDLSSWGADTTMAQRGSIVVVSPHMANLVYAPYLQGVPVEEADLISAAGFIEPVLKASLQKLTKLTEVHDKDLIESVRKKGLKVDQGPDDAGYLLKSLKESGGYYIDVGASSAIAEGRIKILDAHRLARFSAEGAVLDDGTVLPLDLVVLATGYLEPVEDLRVILGDEMAEKIRTVFRFDEESEHANTWRPTPQKGLWIMGGGIGQARNYSRYLAVQLTAAVRGLHPSYRRVDAPGATDRAESAGQKTV